MCLVAILFCMENKKTKLIFKIVGSFQRAMEMAAELEKKPRDFGTGEKLYSAEIHMIEVIGESENENQKVSVTDIADYFGITKGAVSQTFKKLDKKGLVQRYADPVNASRSLLYLTPEGKRVLKSHQEWHEKMDGGFADYLNGLKPSDIFVIKDFLSRYEFSLDNRNS